MAGYTRQDTANNIANGNVIDADDLDSEFNAVEDAFQASTGHTHDGSSGEGAPITKVGPGQDIIVGTTTVLPKANNIIDLGSSAAQYKDGYFDGTLYVDTANVGVSGYTTIEDNEYAVSTGNLTFDVAGDIVLDADGGDVQLQDGGVDYGKLTNRSNQLSIYSGTTESLRLNGADVDALGTLDVTGNTTVGGTLTVTGNTSVSTGNLTVNTGNVSIGGTLGVTGTITGSLSGAVTGNVTGNLTGNVTGNATTATAWQTARTISLTGDVTGTATGVDGSGNISIATTVAPNQVTLGTDTTGNYVASLVAGTGVTLTNNSGEGATPTVAIGQAVGTTSNVTFNDVVVSGNLTVSGTTTTVNTETINLADNQILLNSNYTGSTPTENGGIEIERGTLANKTLVWDETVDKWTVGSETFVAGTFEGNLTGAVTGNASTASTLQTARTIALGGDVTGSASFNGGSNVTITATVADDSHNHVISNVDGLQTALDGKAALAGSTGQAFSASTLNATTVDLGNWTITESAGVLYFATGGTNKMKLDASGNLTVVGNVTAYGTV